MPNPFSYFFNRLKASFEDKKARFIVFKYEKSTAADRRLLFEKALSNWTESKDFLTHFSTIERNVEVKETDLSLNEALITCYFTKKVDPIQGIIRNTPDIKYILPWYESILKNKLFGIVIHDGLDLDFIEKYENKFVQFRKYEAGKYSIFEERWIAYYLFLSKTKLKRAFFTDANDVYITANPFIFASKEKTIYVGRDNANRVRHTGWLLEELNAYQKDAGYKVPETFYFQPVYNAGILGGDRETLLFFIYQMIKLILLTKTERHKDMSLINLVIHQYFFPTITYHVNERKITDPKDDENASHAFLVTGYPLNSEFKKLDLDSNAFFIHK